MASRERELLPCPFCGATAVCTPDQGGNYTVFCHQFCVSTDTSKDVDELVAIWNRRAALAEGARGDEPVARDTWVADTIHFKLNRVYPEDGADLSGLSAAEAYRLAWQDAWLDLADELHAVTWNEQTALAKAEKRLAEVERERDALREKVKEWQFENAAIKSARGAK